MPSEITERVWPKGKKIRQMLVTYIDVGHIQADKAESFMAKMNSRPGWASVIDQLEDQGIAILNMPVRPNSSTRVEIVPLDEFEDEDDFEITIHPECEQEEEGTWIDTLNTVPGIEVEMDDEE